MLVEFNGYCVSAGRSALCFRWLGCHSDNVYVLMLGLTVSIQQDCFKTRLVNYDHRVARRFHPEVIKRSSGYASRATYQNVLCVKFILDSGQLSS